VRIKCKSLISLLAFPIILYAQSQNLRFEHISVEQGLSHEKVRCILQDSQGFMWFGTDDGLNNYDGYNFSTYRFDPDDSTSIGSNSIADLFEDHLGTLWIGTITGGLNKFNREKEIFTRYKYNRDNPSGISSNDVKQIREFRYEEKDVLWIGTGGGLNKMDMVTQEFNYYPHTKKKFPYTYIESMVVDSSGIVWFGTTEGGLYKFNPITEQYTNYQHDPDNPNSISNNRILSLCLDRSGILWIGTVDVRLNKFDPKNNVFLSYQLDPDNPSILRSNFAIAIYEDRRGTLWVGTGLTGLNKFDRQTEQLTRYINEPGDPTSLSDNTILDIFEDKSGVMWIGTWGGVNKIDPGKIQFSVYKNIPGNPNSLNGSNTGTVLESEYGGGRSLWICTKSGLNKINCITGKYTRYVHDPDNARSIPSNVGISLFEDRSGLLWIGTKGDGLIKYDREKEQFTQYLDRDNPTNIINSIYEDQNGVLWLCTRVGGLNKFDRETGLFTRVGNAMFTSQVLEDKSGSFWVASFRGLKNLNRETEEFVTYRHNPQNPNSLSNNNVMTILESLYDEKEVLWIGTEGGLNKFDRTSGSFEHFTVDDGLPNNIINSILEDSRGNLWLGTSEGLSKFNPKSNKFRNYDVGDGLPGNLFWPGGCFKSKDGEMFFGSSKGMVSFYPNRLTDNPHIPEIAITEFLIFNKKVEIKRGNDEEQQREYTFPKHISQLKEIKLSYKENIFSFEFAALDYYSPQKNQYAYKMEGVDPDWVYTDASRRFATYTNLDPGEYTFRVKGSNNDDLWNEKGTSIKVIITPPWWKTNIAYTCYFLIATMILVGIRSYDRKRQQLNHDLELKNLHAEKLEETDRLKSHFFANISHEFRTPLTLILSPVEQLITKTFKGSIEESYVTIRSNAKKLLRLVNQLLSLSKLEAGQVKLQVSEQDIIPVFNRIINLFTSLAERKQIDFDFSFPDSLTIYFDNEKIETVLNNLLTNAFKFTPEGGVVEVLISKVPTPSRFSGHFSKEGNLQIPSLDGLRVDQNMLQIIISNTGPHIPEDHLDKIFDRFYQVDSNNHIEGTGIGLSLTKDLVELHHGKINVESKAGEKTIFAILIPAAKENYTSDEIKGPQENQIKSEEIFTEIDPSEIQISMDKTAIKEIPKLLIVEDNEEVRNYLRINLEEKYNIIEAPNGKIGVQQAENKLPDLIISDVMMPEMDGFEFCDKIKNEVITSHIPVILLTALATRQDKLKGLKTGADEYLPKPFDLEELFIRVENLIQQRKILKERFLKEALFGIDKISSHPAEQEFIEKITRIINKNIDHADYSVENFVQDIGMSRAQLFRKVKAWTNQTPHEFIRLCRLKKAAELLKEKSFNVTEVGFAVGFKDTSHFIRSFKSQFNKTPKEFFNSK
jgi:signal transduction histidine kinase/ligand-binding sensor domain-containing protein/DNA-binding response OmpR family regulator